MTDAQRDFATKPYKTEAGKELGIYKVANTSLYRVAFKSGGELPEKLSGMYTAPTMAAQAIESYLLNHKPDVPKNTVAKQKSSKNKE